MEPMSPGKKCSQCEWTGAPGGRTWETEFQYTIEEFDESNPGKPKSRTETIDLALMNETELFEAAETLLQARFELVFRGFDPDQIDDQFAADGISMPLRQKDAFLVFHNFKTQQVEQVSFFSSHRTWHDFLCITQESKDWMGAFSLDEFHEAAFARSDDTRVWYVDMPEEYSDEDFMSEPANFGVDAVKALLAEKPMSESDLKRQGYLLDTKIYWPHWFDEGLMLRRVQRLR
jgi:hypothetical protein